MSQEDHSPEVEALLAGIYEERERRTEALGFALLPCPFCGGDPYVEYHDESDMEYVQCDCGADYVNEDLSGWNSRVSDPVALRGKH